MRCLLLRLSLWNFLFKGVFFSERSQERQERKRRFRKRMRKIEGFFLQKALPFVPGQEKSPSESFSEEGDPLNFDIVMCTLKRITWSRQNVLCLLLWSLKETIFQNYVISHVLFPYSAGYEQRGELRQKKRFGKNRTLLFGQEGDFNGEQKIFRPLTASWLYWATDHVSRKTASVTHPSLLLKYRASPGERGESDGFKRLSLLLAVFLPPLLIDW